MFVADRLIGRVLSERYRVLRKVGEGTLGTVYQAHHALIDKTIALKVLSPELARRGDLVARFLQEVRSASRIGHENVIDISDFGQSSEGIVYVAMEFLEGQDLAQLIRAEGPIAWTRARPILMQIAKALRAAHEHGIIHRDIKPENVFLVQREGRRDFVKVLDFGIAKAMNADADSPRLTQKGTTFGTPEYMSPEQAQALPPDHRVDVYAVGCLMYHLLTGDVPFRGEDFMATLTKHLTESPVPPRERRPDLDIPEEVEEICLRALRKDRDERWPDMDAFFRALGGAGGEPFESSGGYGSHPSLRLAVLPQANQTARRLKAETLPVPVRALTPLPARTTGEPLPDVIAASTRAMLIILGAGGALVLGALLVPRLLAPSKPPAAAAPPAPAAVAAPPPRVVTAPAAAAAPEKAGAAAAPQAVGGAPGATPAPPAEPKNPPGNP